MKSRSAVRGFTLLEVLVSTVILFSVLVTISLAYRGALQSSEKADAHLKISGVVPHALEKVRHQIRLANSPAVNQQGEGILLDVSYQWQASLVDVAAPPQQYDPDSGNYQVYADKFRLWRVELSLAVDSTSQQYSYFEVSWDA